MTKFRSTSSQKNGRLFLGKFEVKSGSNRAVDYKDILKRVDLIPKRLYYTYIERIQYWDFKSHIFQKTYLKVHTLFGFFVE